MASTLLPRAALAAVRARGAAPQRALRVAAGAQDDARRSRKDDGRNKFSQERARDSKRRRGRPAYLRSPDDSPMRDGNRDRLMGLLTERAAKTLLYYFSETNVTAHAWFAAYLRQCEIPRDGKWDDVSGETFLRRLLSLPVQGTRWGDHSGADPMYDATKYFGVDPRGIAQRVMEIRSQLAREMAQDLAGVAEENTLLMRETLSSSLAAAFAAEPAARAPPLPSVDDSAGGSDD